MLTLQDSKMVENCGKKVLMLNRLRMEKNKVSFGYIYKFIVRDQVVLLIL